MSSSRFFSAAAAGVARRLSCVPCLVVAVGYEAHVQRSNSSRCTYGDAHAKAPGEGPTQLGLVGAVGNTPLLYLRSVSAATGCHVFAKAEFMNPTASVKDRAAKALLEVAERSGKLRPGGTICEGTGGNTGISLAHLAISKGYKVILFMPSGISTEKIEHQRRLGAEVHVQPMVPFANPENYAKKAETVAAALTDEGQNVVFTNQFENMANFQAHYDNTGPEIWIQTKGKVDAFVCSAGTGGTIAGVSASLKDLNSNIKTYLIDPSGSVLFSFVKEGKVEVCHKSSSVIEGVGIGRITANMKKAKLDGAFFGTDQEAIDMAYFLLRNDGIFVGPSAALNVVGAVKTARAIGPDKVIVTILCDSGERYASKMYNAKWLEDEKLTPTKDVEKDYQLAFVK